MTFLGCLTLSRYLMISPELYFLWIHLKLHVSSEANLLLLCQEEWQKRSVADASRSELIHVSFFMHLTDSVFSFTLVLPLSSKCLCPCLVHLWSVGLNPSQDLQVQWPFPSIHRPIFTTLMSSHRLIKSKTWYNVSCLQSLCKLKCSSRLSFWFCMTLLTDLWKSVCTWMQHVLYIHACGSERQRAREENRFGLRVNTLVPWAISQVAEWCWRLEAPERTQAPPRSPLTFNPPTT